MSPWACLSFLRWLDSHTDVTPEDRATRTKKLDEFLNNSCNGQTADHLSGSDEISAENTSAHTTEIAISSELEDSDDRADGPPGAPMFPSLGAVQPFEGGDLADPGVLQAALIARSFNNEVCWPQTTCPRGQGSERF